MNLFPETMKSGRTSSLALFLISSALLALEISLMRILRIEGFGTFTATAIALAMTGFGAGGTAVFLFRDRIRGRERIVSLYAAVLLIFTLGSGYWLSMHVVFDPLRVLWDVSQIPRLLLRLFVYTVPFMCGSIVVVISFTVQRAGKAYFFNLTGSGFGVAAMLAALYLLPPDRIFIVALVCAAAAAALSGIRLRPKPAHAVSLSLLALAGFVFFSFGGIRVLPYKGLKLALNLPDAGIVERDLSPYGTLEVVESGMIRRAPGLSLAFQGSLPRQLGLFLDGDSLSVIDMPASGAGGDYLRYQTQAAAYTLHDAPDVLVIGLGGGSGALRARIHGARSVAVAETNPRLVRLITGMRRNTALWNGVRVRQVGARILLAGKGRTFDLIELSEPDSSVSSIGGIYASDTNYTLTEQAFEEYAGRLSRKGTLSATVLLRFPPRSLLKMVDLSAHAARSRGADPARCMIVLRSWATGTVLTGSVPFTAEEVAEVKRFCRRMFFDLVYYPGIREEETNRYNILDEELYYREVKNILEPGSGATRRYPFNVRAPTDDRPYFSFFFRISRLPFLLRVLGGRWAVAVEGGELVLFFTFVLTVVLSFILILLPHFFARGQKRRLRDVGGIKPRWRKLNGEKVRGKEWPQGSGGGRILLYFALIGVGYMSTEIVLIGRFLRFLENPLFAGSTIITALLLCSGTGSYLQDRLPFLRERATVFALIFCAVYIPILLLLFRMFDTFLAAAALGVRLPVSLALLVPAGIAMGMPFPSVIERLRQWEGGAGMEPSPPMETPAVRPGGDYGRRRASPGGGGLVPWAWSVNGYLSVVASTGAVLASALFGLSVTGLLAAGCYAAALLVYAKGKMVYTNGGGRCTMRSSIT